MSSLFSIQQADNIFILRLQYPSRPLGSTSRHRLLEDRFVKIVLPHKRVLNQQTNLKIALNFLVWAKTHMLHYSICVKWLFRPMHMFV
jgi:hypothetical protein